MRRIMFFVTLLSLVAISSFAGGVGVGNGKSVYHAPQGFSVEYRDGLSLSVESERIFKITNANLVLGGEKVSKISFAVTQGKAHDIDELAKWLAKEYPARRFTETELPGTRGFYSDIHKAGRLDGLYFLLTSNGDLVEITIEAYPEGNGLAWIAPIVRSFVYDATPPVIEELMLKNSVWPAGTHQRVYFRAHDDYSGIALGQSPLAIMEKVGADGKRSAPHFFSRGDAREEGKGWYSLGFDLNQYLPPGTYRMSLLSINDRAYNTRSLGASDNSSSPYYESMDGPKIPVLKFAITNHGTADDHAPIFGDFRTDDSIWEAGKAYQIFFRLTDDISGVDVSKIRCLGLESSFRINGDRFYTSDCGKAKAEKDGWYSVELPLSHYLPGGEYFLENIEFSDKAGNESVLFLNSPDDGYYRGSTGQPLKVPLFRVNVRNAGQEEDITGPKLLEIYPENNEWKAGQRERIHFKAKDDLSGVAAGKNSYGWALPLKKEQGMQTIFIDTEIVSDGNDWYHVDFMVSPFIRGGDYSLGLFSFSDKAGNSGGISCTDGGPADPCVNKNGPKIPQIHFKVVR